VTHRPAWAYLPLLLLTMLPLLGCERGRGMPAWGAGDPANQLRKMTGRVKQVRHELDQANQATSRDFKVFYAAQREELHKGTAAASRKTLAQQLQQLQNAAERRYNQVLANLTRMQTDAQKIDVSRTQTPSARPDAESTQAGKLSVAGAKGPGAQAPGSSRVKPAESREQLLHDLAAARGDAESALGQVHAQVRQLKEQLGIADSTDGKPAPAQGSSHNLMSTF
jgi:hypothetical protein